MVWAGAAFLFVYGALRFQAAWIGGEQLNAAQEDAGSLKAAIATLLALTWLNPHVYLDTVVLIGSISTEYGTQASLFGLGAVIASFVFFFGYTYNVPIFFKI